MKWGLKMRIIDFQCMYCVQDTDSLIEDGTTKVIVSKHDDMVYVVMGTSQGKESYLLTKTAAKELAKALTEKAQ